MTSSIAFVMLAHKDPGQVARLVSRLHPNPVFVHVDTKAPAAVYDALKELEQDGSIHLLPRFRTGWASWGLVEATLGGLTAAEAVPGWSHLFVISGQDYPLWPISRITQFLAERPADSWIHQARIPVPARRIGDADGGEGRIRRWTLTVRGRHLRMPVKRALPAGLIPHYGQQQCCISEPLVRTILAEDSLQPELRRFFRHTQAPDELMLPTLAMSSPLADRVSDDNLWYMDWSAGGPHPKVLTMEDYDGLARHARDGGDMCGPSPVKLFARKFDERVSRDLLDRIDGELLERPVP